MAEDRRPVLVGECPNASTDGRYPPLSGSPAKVLCELAGLDPIPGGTHWGRWYWALVSEFVPVNLMRRHVGVWRSEERVRAEERAGELLAEYPPPRVLVLLGRNVMRAFRVPGGHAAEFYEWDEPRVGIVGLPHPSGRNLLLNDPEHRGLCGQALQEALRRSKAA